MQSTLAVLSLQESTLADTCWISGKGVGGGGGGLEIWRRRGAILFIKLNRCHGPEGYGFWTALV